MMLALLPQYSLLLFSLLLLENLVDPQLQLPVLLLQLSNDLVPHLTQIFKVRELVLTLLQYLLLLVQLKFVSVATLQRLVQLSLHCFCL